MTHLIGLVAIIYYFQVNLNITIDADIVKVNGKLTELDVVTKYELNAEIGRFQLYFHVF